MKNGVLLLLLSLFVLPVVAQPQWQTKYFIQYSQDMAMAINGPYKGNPNDIGTTYNAEVSIGYEQSKGVSGYRLTGRVEFHPAINYTKATWLDISYMLKNHLLFFKVPGFNQYAGVEFQTIYRENPNYDWSDPYNYTKHLNTPLQLGLNAELQYMVKDSNWGVAANLNVFQPEEIDGKKTRWDVMIGIVWKFQKSNSNN